MKKNTLLNKILCGVLIGSLVLSAGSFAFADHSRRTDAGFWGAKAKQAAAHLMKNGKFDKGMNAVQGKNLKVVLDQLVKEGKITQEKADTIIEYLQKKAEEMKKLTPEQRKARFSEKKSQIWEELKSAGIVTDKDINAIQEKKQALREEKRALMENKKAESLNSLVESGVITAADLEKINGFLKAKSEERRAEMDKIKAMTAEERKAYFADHKLMRQDPFKQMVEKGVITQVQADEIKKAMHFGKQKCVEFKGPMVRDMREKGPVSNAL